MKKYIPIFLLLLVVTVSSKAQVALGDKVPNFSSIDQDGAKWALKKQIKSADYLVVYFYPAAFTGGCTKQACTYRDQKGELASVGAQVVGVSGDKPETLALFALEHSLNFTLLADESGELATLFGVPHSEGGAITREIKGQELELARNTTIKRWTFIVDQKGTLIYKDSEVDAAEDGNKVVEFLASLK